MADIAIQVRGLGKQYRIGASRKSFTTLRDTVSDAAAGMARSLRGNGSRHADETIWALKDVSFEVKRGEVLGIIGRNGAGKSTLLKILSRITEPTCGEVDVYGRVASLLEVGTGFHPELTGRENVYLNGAVLGMHRREIQGKFDEIVDFSGVEKFIDTPVKHYSSGMYMRLAFAVAAHLEPEILLVDEVLAVGDAEFQKKCLGKMSEAATEGRTVLFVSHNMQAISILTSRCIVLSNGLCVFDGTTEASIEHYLRLGGEMPAIYSDHASATEPRILRVEVQTSEPNSVHLHGQPLAVRILLNVPSGLQSAALAFQVVSRYQQPYMHLWLYDSDQPFARDPGTYELICRIPRLRLYIGNYSLVAHFSARTRPAHNIRIEGICPFEVVMYGRDRDFGWDPAACVYIEDCEWSIQEPETHLEMLT